MPWLLAYCLSPLMDKNLTEVKGPVVSGLRTESASRQQLGGPLGSIWSTKDVYLLRTCFWSSSVHHETWLWDHPWDIQGTWGQGWETGSLKLLENFLLSKLPVSFPKDWPVLGTLPTPLNSTVVRVQKMKMIRTCCIVQGTLLSTL